MDVYADFLCVPMHHLDWLMSIVAVGGLIRGIEPDADPFKGSAPSLIILISRIIIATCAWYCGLLECAVWPSTADYSSLGFL